MTPEDDLLDRVLDITVAAMRSVNTTTCHEHHHDPTLEWFRAGIAYTAGSLLHNLGHSQPGTLTVAEVVRHGFAALAGRVETE